MPERFNGSKKIFLMMVVILLVGPLFLSSARDRSNLMPIDSTSRITGLEGMHSKVQIDTLQARLKFLTSWKCAGRATGTEGADVAANWIEDHFQRIGLKISNIKFNGGRNIMGLLEAGDSLPTIIVMAHYDGVGSLNGKLYPGADSNASGVVAMVSLAEMLKAMQSYGKKMRTNILFVATDGKSNDMAGAKMLYAMTRSKDVPMVINIDQIGSSLSPIHEGKEDYLIMLSDQGVHRSILSRMNSKYGLNLDLGFDYYGSEDFTKLFYRNLCEQKVFLDHGRKAVMFTSGITMNNNKPSDTLASLNLEVLKKRICLIFQWLNYQE